jgi:hypothetical protein
MGGYLEADAGMSGDVLYAYGVVRSDFDVGRMPAGLDDAPVVRVTEAGMSALVSRLPHADYAPSVIEENSGEVVWLSPRAMAHDRVLTWAQEHGGVIPLPMFSMWGSDAALSQTLRERATALATMFERVSGADEFGLRVHRRDAAMLERADTLDEDLARLRREAEAASPGQRYLLERKIGERAKGAVRAASQRMAREIFEDLRRLAREALARPLTPTTGGVNEATMVLNGAFLVGRDHLEAFRVAVAAHVRDNESKGLSFDFTGPWPPYNFVGEIGASGSSAMTGAAPHP